MSAEMDRLFAEMRSYVERIERDNAALTASNNQLAQRNDELCDEVYELQQQLSASREAAE